jgi:hypothetical protein
LLLGGGGGALLLGAVVLEQTTFTVVLLLMPPALAVIVALPAVLGARKTAEACPPEVVTVEDDIVPVEALRVTLVPSATGPPVADLTPRAMAVEPPQLIELPAAWMSTCVAGPATGVRAATAPPYC